MSFYDRRNKISDIEHWHKVGSIRIHWGNWYGAYIVFGGFSVRSLIARIIQH